MKSFWFWLYKFSGERLRRCTQPAKRPTIAELEAMLERGEDGENIVALPNGSLIVV